MVSRTSTTTAAATPDTCTLIVTPSAAGAGRVVGTVLDPAGDPVHVDTLDPSDAAAVAAFLTAAETAAVAAGHPFDAAAGRATLLQAALAVNAAPPPASSAAANADAILASLALQVNGETPDGKVVVYSEITGKVSQLPSLSRLRKPDLVQVAGAPAGLLLERSNGRRGPGTYTVAEAVEALAMAASDAPRHEPGNVWGQGVWRHGDELFVVNGDKALRGDDAGGWSEYPEHRVGGKALERNRSLAWAPDDLLDRLRNATDAEARDGLARLRELANNWTWARPADADGLAGIVLAGYMAPSLTWRPTPELVAKTGDGKSTMIAKMLVPLWAGPVGKAIWINPSTAAGVRQYLGVNGLPLVLDEWDSWAQHRPALTEYLRSGGRGGVTLRGTPGQTAIVTRLESMIVRVGIEGGRGEAQDENRRLILSLATPAKHRLPKLPDERALFDLRVGLIASAIRAARPADALACELSGVTEDGIHPRVAESLAVPAAFLATFEHGLGATAAQAERHLRRLLPGRAGELDTTSPETAILRVAMSAQLRLSGPLDSTPVDRDRTVPASYPVGRLLAADAGVRFSSGFAGHNSRAEEVKRVLASVGFRVVPERAKNGGPPPAFVDGGQVCKTLLKGSPHESSDLNQILARIDGAERSKQRLGPGIPPTSGVFVPLSAFDLEDSP